MAVNHHRFVTVLLLVVVLISSIANAIGDSSYSRFSGTASVGRNLQEHYSGGGNNRKNEERDYHMKKIEAFKESLIGHQRDSLISPSPPFTPSSISPPPVGSNPRVYHVTSYGADPTGKSDSTDAILKAFSDASNPPNGDDTLIAGIANAGGSQIQLDGGIYLVSRSLKFPVTGVGNIVIQGGTLKASDTFPNENYLIDLSPTPTPSSSEQSTTSTNSNPNNTRIINDNKSTTTSYTYEYITLRDIHIDCNFHSNGINIINSLRTNLDNLFISHFISSGIHVQSGHETLIRNTYIGQHITAGGDPTERNFTGTAITLAGNDNVLSNVIIFSAETGVVVSGQANLLSGVHCYNKATGFGGTGIYLKLPGLTQTRIVDSYLDYTGIVAEDPVQLIIKNCFFLGDAGVLLKSVGGVIDGVVIVDNMFSGNGNGKEIVRLDESVKTFGDIGMVVIERNSVRGMNLKTTNAKSVVDVKNGTTRWEVDFGGVLLFPDLIRHVQYSAVLDGGMIGGDGANSSSSSGFPRVSYGVRSLKGNKIVIESDVEITEGARFYVSVDQGSSSS